MAISAQIYKAIKEIVDDRMQEIKVTREDFNDLKKIVNELAEAQKASEERISRLEVAVEKLAEAQKRTEMRVEELAEAQKRTEIKLDKLIGAVFELKKRVDKFSEEVGISLEELGARLLPPYFKEVYGISVKSLATEYLRVDGRRHEFDLIGSGEKDGKKVLLIGEVKSRMSPSELNRYIKIIKRVKVPKDYTAVPFIFVRRLAGFVEREAKKAGLIAISGSHL